MKIFVKKIILYSENNGWRIVICIQQQNDVNNSFIIWPLKITLTIIWLYYISCYYIWFHNVTVLLVLVHFRFYSMEPPLAPFPIIFDSAVTLLSDMICYKIITAHIHKNACNNYITRYSIKHINSTLTPLILFSVSHELCFNGFLTF